MSNQNALATLDVDQAINQLANGALLKHIAARYKCDKAAVYRKLVKADPEGYRAAISEQAHAIVDNAMADVLTCDAETVNIARARVDAAFRYAKAHNEAYRDKQELTHQLGDSFASLLEQVAARKRSAALPNAPVTLDAQSGEIVKDA